MKKALYKGKFFLIILSGLVYNIVLFNEDPNLAKTVKSNKMEKVAKYEKPILDSTSQMLQNIIK